MTTTADSGVQSGPKAGGRSDTMRRARSVFANSGMIPALALVIVIGTMLSPAFLTAPNLSNVLRISAVVGLLAIGQTLVILAGGGGIDLSVGSVTAAAGVVGALYQGYGLTGTIVAALATGAFFGLVNGLGVTTARLQPFIVTLATLTIARGVAFQLSNATPIYVSVPGLDYLATGVILGIPVPIVILGAALLVGQLVLSRTVYGRKLYAMGGNEEAAFFSGINVNRLRLSVYVISGLLAGLAGVLATARLSTADANFGTGYELAAIAAVVVGGAPLTGGRGSILGTGVGVLIIALFENLLNLLNVNPWTQLMVTGLIVIVVVALNRKGEAGPDRRIWKGLPLYAALVAGALLLFFVL
ncbi:ABC transporter permease [Microbispora sp. H11081]|uniref:ABC transporter permease n=1 Tax=Microbispora sp. H11081 TaxID=2729107 RepID=UPI00147294FF|nr:ABC transporter permease [Microbispora sp. H11081]